MMTDIPGDDDRALSRHLAEVAARVAREAGDLLRPAFRADMALEWKADLHDPVTIHDRRAEALIRERLMAAVPGSVVVGEEGGQSGDPDEDAVSWFVDPIDGTANFARGLAFWCVSIGATKGGRILAGAVHDPVAGHLFTADLQGATLDGQPLGAPPAVEEAKALLITGYPVTRDFRRCGREAALASQADLIEAFSTLRRPGSAALSLCHVAAGWADAAAGFGVNAWDVTAAILILEQAGGSYEPLTLGRVPDDAPPQTCPGYVARGPGGRFPTLDRVAREIDARRRRTAQAVA
jgi:myo-inositol-1(or 4)-monophosphatase